MIPLVLSVSLALVGCSGGEPEPGASGDSGGSGEAPQPSTSAGRTAAAPEETTAEATAAPEETSEEGDEASTALSGGLDEARSEAESWNEDAELYAIATPQPTMNAEGESESWLYSFVSESAGATISIPYSGGEAQSAQGQSLPEGYVERIAGDTLSVNELIDSPEAVQSSGEVREYLEENPQQGARAGVDSASGDDPEWILTVTAEEPIQERVPAGE